MLKSALQKNVRLGRAASAVRQAPACWEECAVVGWIAGYVLCRFIHSVSLLHLRWGLGSSSPTRLEKRGCAGRYLYGELICCTCCLSKLARFHGLPCSGLACTVPDACKAAQSALRC